MKQHHYLSSTYIKLLIQANKQLEPLIISVVNMPLDKLINESFIDGAMIESLINLFHQHGLDSWVLRHNKQLGVSSHGPLGFAVLTAANLEQAIQVAADYSSIRLSYYDCIFRHKNKRAEFIFNEQTKSSLTSRWMIESGVYVVKQLIETIVAHPLGTNAQITFKHAPPSYRKELENFYGVRCEFEQEINAICIPSSWCQISSPLSEPATFNSNLRKCQELKQALPGEQDIIKSTRQILKNHFEQLTNSATFNKLEHKKNHKHQNSSSIQNNTPSLSFLAQQKHMTTRTFTRHLAKHDYSYRKMLEEVRQQHACHLLENTHYNIADIGACLGYLESANFIRAFKAWFSCTPTQWRKNRKN